jgi:hypothetical protein
MNIKYLLLPLAICSVVAIAAEKPAPATVPSYSYGMPLDIHKVISITEPEMVCGVVTARVTYEDSKGAQHELDYRRWSSGCGILDDGGMSMGY